MPTPVQPLLRGSPAQRLRLASGLVLFVFAATHFLTPGTLLLAAALLLHAGSALVKLAGRRPLRLPAWEWLQLGLGLAIPLLLLPHIVNTRVASLALGVDTT